MRSDRESAAAWEAALDHVIQGAHLAIGEDLSTLLDDAVRPLGLTAEMLVADTSQRVLTALRPGPPHRIDLAASIGGQAYQLGEILPDADADGGPLLWVPVLDGTDRLGVVRVGFTEHGDRAAHDDTRLRRRLLTMASLMGHVLGSKTVYSDQLRRRRSNGPLTPASELLWQLLPPRTVATERVVVSATLEPQRDVAGDAFDYNVEGDVVDLAVYDAAGHDLRASITTALAITGVRNARRSGEEDLAAIAAHADTLIDAQPGPRQFATAFLARLDTVTGTLAYLNAGHVPPLLIRRGNVVQRLEGPHRAPSASPDRRVGRRRRSSSSNPVTACSSTPTGSPRPATSTGCSSARTSWSSSPNTPPRRASRPRRRCAGSPPPCSTTSRAGCRTTPRSCSSSGPPPVTNACSRP